MTDRTMKDGTSQNDRFLDALREGYIYPDELRFTDLLAMGAEYARNLKYYNLRNAHDGNWETFFTADEAVIMAVIRATDLEQFERDFFKARILLSGINGFKPTQLPNYQLARKIDDWCRCLQQPQSEAGRALCDAIENVIREQLARELHFLRQFVRQYDDRLAERFEAVFAGCWFEDVDPRALPDFPAEKESIERRLKTNFYAFCNAVAGLKESAATHLPVSLQNRSHSSAIGLYVTFVKLFQKVQSKLNQFTNRHLDFYYKDILKATPRTVSADTTYLVFTPDRDDRIVLIEKGTEFTAGSEADVSDLAYEAQNDTVVHGSVVEALYTLYFDKDPLSSPEYELGFASRAKTNRIPVLKTDSSTSEQKVAAWPMFGATGSETGTNVYNDAAIGFAIASPVLFLQEGERHINLLFRIVSDAVDQNDLLEPILEKLTQSFDTNRQDVFFKAFRSIFNIFITTENGWLEVEEYLPLMHEVDKTCEENCLKIQIRLSPDVEPITAFSPPIHGKQYHTDWPVLRLVINPTAYIYPYFLLRDIIIREVEINVEVKGVRDILLYNHLGKLDPNSPFLPFGPTPAVGSYLIVGSAETARKNITDLSMNIEWGDLPTEKGGFPEYYQAYERSFSTHVFEASISALSSGRWLPYEAGLRPVVKLFRTEADDDPESDSLRIRKRNLLSFKKAARFLSPNRQISAQAPFSYDYRITDGFLKMTLVGPEYAFGHKDYPTILANVLSANTRLKKPHRHKPTPNLPYTPKINAVSIDYRASASITLERTALYADTHSEEQFFHVHPFGVERLSAATQNEIRMLPAYHSTGFLYIGLSGQELTGLLTLFFHLHEDSTPDTNAKPPEFDWHYLSSNQWKKLEQTEVVSDTTNGFLSSGIVTMNIPDDITKDNTVMPSGLYWLAISADNRLDTLCSLYSVYTQALEVARKIHDDSPAHLKTALPAGVIKESRITIPGIKKIDQVIDSFGGMPDESDDQLKIRIGERLRHKNRASLAWDYERMILEKFPQIYKVKCFANMVYSLTPENRTRPGQVMITVIPLRQKSNAGNLRPMVHSLLLKEIKDFVMSLTSPFVKVDIINPAYEQIQVRCAVKFTKDVGVGHYISRLNQAVTDYLSPWNDIGYRVRFGWCVREYDLKSFIRNQDYVEFVTDFSMLRISDDGKGFFHLFDTVAEGVEQIHPKYPWSIAIPVRRHFIKTTGKPEVIDPEITGVDELEIGSTFIITGKESNG